jgi:Cu/Ag efflux protein CusF
MRLQLFAAVMTLALFAGCATEKPSGRMQDVIEARATVTAIDRPHRLVTLRDESGRDLVVAVSDQVKRLDEVKVGDQVVVSYTEALAWAVKPASKGTSGVSSQDSMTRAPASEPPGATVGRTTTVTTTITAIDLANGTVTLTGPAGGSQTIKARDPANLKKVQVGDLVDITYSEAVAVAVKPVTTK